MDTANNKTEDESPANANDYLWDRSGERDPEVQRLEALLEEFRHVGPAPVFPAIVQHRRWTFFPWRMRLFPVLAGAALLAITVVTFLLHQRKPVPVVMAGWGVFPTGGRTPVRRKKHR